MSSSGASRTLETATLFGIAVGDKNILADDKDTGSWTYLAQTKAVAEWSCRTAAQVVDDFCSGGSSKQFPDSVGFRAKDV
jgi:hypothetical protein